MNLISFSSIKRPSLYACIYQCLQTPNTALLRPPHISSQIPLFPSSVLLFYYYYCDLLLKEWPPSSSHSEQWSPRQLLFECVSDGLSMEVGWGWVGRDGGAGERDLDYNTQNALAMQILHLTCKWKPLQLIQEVEVEGGERDPAKCCVMVDYG